MPEIEFSVMEAIAGDAQKLLPLLQTFEKQSHTHVNLTGIPWSKGWSEIVKFGIYGQGPDVSAIGTSWIGSLTGMEILRPFTPEQISALGGAESFFKSSWNTGHLNNNPNTTWAIPWVGDALVFYYWEEALKKAGVQDFKSVFSTNTALIETLKTLQKNGITYPLSLNVTNMSIILHEAAHWVWAAGGDFVSADGLHAIFNQPAAMQGWKNYFSLLPFMSPEWLKRANASGDSFMARESVIQMGGPYMGVADLLNRGEEKEQMGIAIPPKGAYVGGASFVIWKYSIHNAEAFELIRFLSSQPISIPASPDSYSLPTRREAINIPVTEKERNFHNCYLQAMQTGRSFPTMRLWGLFEEKLVLEISNIWASLFAEPDQDLEACLHKHFDPLTKRLDIILGN